MFSLSKTFFTHRLLSQITYIYLYIGIYDYRKFLLSFGGVIIHKNLWTGFTRHIFHFSIFLQSLIYRQQKLTSFLAINYYYLIVFLLHYLFYPYSILRIKAIQSMFLLYLTNFEKGVTLQRMSENKNSDFNCTIGARKTSNALISKRWFYEYNCLALKQRYISDINT